MFHSCRLNDSFEALEHFTTYDITLYKHLVCHVTTVGCLDVGVHLYHEFDREVSSLSSPDVMFDFDFDFVRPIYKLT